MTLAHLKVPWVAVVAIVLLDLQEPSNEHALAQRSLARMPKFY